MELFGRPFYLIADGRRDTQALLQRRLLGGSHAPVLTDHAAIASVLLHREGT